MRRLVGCVLLVAGVAGVLGGCARPINREAEARIRRILPQYVGPARSWQVRVDGAPMETLRGRLHRVRIDGVDVRLGRMIDCESLRIDLANVVVDMTRKRIRSIGETSFTAVLNEQAVNRYLRENPPPEDEPVRIRSVRILDGRVYAEESRWMLGRAWPYTVVAEPRLVSSTRLEFAPDRMTVLGLRVPLPAGVLRWLAKRLSDGFDFTTLPFPVQIARFRTERGRFVVEGSADVLEMLNASPPGAGL